MLHRLCGPPSIPLSFSLAAVVPRRSTYRVSYDTNGSKSAHIKLTTFRAWTTRVSNPVCSPCFRPWGSVFVQWSAFAFDVLPDIYAFHRYTWNSNHLSNTLANQFPMQFLSWAQRFHIRLNQAPCGPFTPNKSEQRSPPTYYRGCWHVVSRGFLPRYRHISSRETVVYNPKTFIPHAALLGQTFVHCPKFSTAASRRSLGSSQSQCGWSSSQTSYPSSAWWAITSPTT